MAGLSRSASANTNRRNSGPSVTGLPWPVVTDAFFEVLGDDAARWRRQMVRRRYGRDEVLMHEGEAGNTLHVLEEGRVLIEVSTEAGDVAALGVAGPAEVVGEMAILGDGRRTARVTALEPTQTVSITRDRLEELRRTEPDVDTFMLALLTHKLVDTTNQLMEVLFLPVETRVMRVVDRLADVFDVGKTPIDVRIRQEDLASIAGTRRQTANRPLKEAEAAGAIGIRRGRIEILDRDLVRRLAG